MDFKEKLQDYQNIINTELNKYNQKQECLESILNKSKEYSLMAGGKRIRPILVIASYSLFKEDYQKSMPYAIALEMVHNFSLIHDDLPGIDNDDFRHGKPTNHKQFNEATAILAGDSLLNNAYKIISNDLKNTKKIEELQTKIKVFEEFSDSVDKMIIGEYVDTELEGQEFSKETLEYIHKNKTGALLKLSIRMGAILANANEEQLQKLTNYSEKIGLAFQIKDDILSEEGDEKQTGKPVGNDKERGKCTYISYYGIDGAKEELERLINEAIKELECFGKKAEFLNQLALYIQNRNK